jgi:hypothetical protein
MKGVVMVMDSGPIPERSFFWNNWKKIIVPKFYMMKCYVVFRYHTEFGYQKNKYRAIAITIDR